MSLAPTAVRLVLVEGENGDGATVDEEDFDIGADHATVDAAEQVISAILGTRDGAAEGGYQLMSTGVSWTDPIEAVALHDALAARKIENVMLVSAFLAAAALAHAVGNETDHARTALLFVEPAAATLAVVDGADGSIADFDQQLLADDDDAAVAQLATMVCSAEALQTCPDAVFVVGAGVDIPLIKPALQAATSLPVTAPDEPETALARGAALASANARLVTAATVARAYAQDPGTGALAYSAVADGSVDATDVVGVEQRDPKPFALLGSVLASIFIIGVAALVFSLAISFRTTSDVRPDPGQNIVAPPQPAPVPVQEAPVPVQEAPVPVPAAPAAPVPVPAASVPAPVPEAPAPAPAAPAPVPAAPAPVPAAPIPIPVPIPIPLPPILSPQLPFDPDVRDGFPGGRFPRGGGDRDDDGRSGGRRGGIDIPGIPGGGGRRGGIDIPGIPGI
ncbi:hypothetical protein B8W66_19355 [Mycobacterium decipiens]|uniref:DUF7159 domain-containing protein n=1 Tax=Mycobacterium decipiens TaxID=1430326 RepID=A0A1X2LQN7_9MYCO|nr:hypothetical protein [Mycobacterium decipiens]OSC38770.1 hypothetical protein B8W66_19355 [Mycobacterium decipiens]